MRRKSPKMLEAEALLGQPLEEALPRLYTEIGFIATAQKLGINRSTLWYWFLKFGIRIDRVLVQTGPTHLK